MKKSLYLTLILIAALAVILPACGGGKSLGKNIHDGDTQTSKTEGWMDENTFRMVGMGAPMKDETDKFVRKATAKEAATIDAQVKIIEKFTGAKVQGAAGVKNFRLTGFAAAKEIEGAIKGGSVFEVTWDKETQDCTVIYEVKAKGLKKKVDSSDIK